jgi:uncharacterized protein YbaP (TraB family)
MNSKIKVVITAILLVAQSHITPAQTSTARSVFWEVSGRGLSQPSYLFGTFHLIGKSHIDTLTHVLDKFESSTTLVSEVILDSTAFKKVMAASMLQGTNLRQVLGDELFKQTSAWLQEIAGHDLYPLNGVNPITVQIYIMMLLQQKYAPASNPAAEIAMDQYFQQMAHERGKALVGLETIEEQIQVVYGQLSYARQAELLAIYLKEKDKAYDRLVAMNRAYATGDLQALERMIYDENYNDGELDVMLYHRNQNWMRQLPALFQQGHAFVAIGAMHLTGSQGLIALLRQQGYQVRPLSLR